MLRIRDQVVDREAMHDPTNRSLKIGEGIKMATERDGMFGGEDGMGRIGFHEPSSHQHYPS
jgi:hypothetical protein